MILVDSAQSMIRNEPITLSAVILVLTGTISYLYRERDKDRKAERERFLDQIDRLEEEINDLRNRKEKRKTL
jgi:hypothetical protein